MKNLNISSDALYEVLKWNVHALIPLHWIDKTLRHYVVIARASNVFRAIINKVNTYAEFEKMEQIIKDEFGIDTRVSMPAIVPLNALIIFMKERHMKELLDIMPIDFSIRRRGEFINLNNVMIALKAAFDLPDQAMYLTPDVYDVLEIFINRWPKHFEFDLEDNNFIFVIKTLRPIQI